MEGKVHQHEKLFEHEFGAGTALTLRLTHSYFGTGRIFIADRGFSSVKTLIALKQRGLYFMVLVKMARKQYPKVWLNNWASGNYNGGEKPTHGSHVVLEATDTCSEKFYAVCWA